MPLHNTTAADYTAESLIERLENDQPIDLALPEGGFLHMERPLPFLTLYRAGDQPDRYQLHSEEAAWCLLRGEATDDFRERLGDLLGYLSDKFGGVLLLDIWVAESGTAPRATIHGPTRHQPAIVDHLRDSLQEIRFAGGPLQTAIGQEDRRHPPGTRALFSSDLLKRHEILYLGLEFTPFFTDEDGQIYPVMLRSFQEQLRTALQSTFYQFVRLQTTWNAVRFHQLSSRRVSGLVWEIDRQLVEISERFRFLMLVSATNDEEAFQRFEESDFQREPTFHYRFLPIDPEGVKRELYNLPVEKIKDPTLAYFLRDKREETARMVDMLAHRGSPDFLYSSMQIFGGVEESLLDIANSLLTIIPQPRPQADDDTAPERIGAEKFLQLCRQELDHLRRQWPDFDPRAEIRNDLSGLMVSQGTLYIDQHFSSPPNRVEALIQHEVGTHVLTYWNGRAQPLGLLYSGVPGYEDLQEGIAVLAEWFVGGLSRSRLRTLAARVVAIDYMIRGHSFTETFHLLYRKHGIGARSAFETTARTYRGGGFTKDAVYLRGLVQLLEYLSGGKDLETLFIGKIRVDYIPLVEELIERGILRPSPLMPRYYQQDREAGHPKLKRLQQGMTVFDLIR